MSAICEPLRRCILLMVVCVLWLGACSDDPGPHPELSALRSELNGAQVGLVNSWSVHANERRPVPPSPAEFQDWQKAVRSQLRSRLEFAYPAAPTPVRVVRQESRPGLERRHLLIESFDGSEIPAVLQYPADGPNRGAVLVIPGHVRPQQSGLSQLVYEPDSYQRAAATELAKKGYITLAFELRGFGLLGDGFDTNHLNVAHNAIAAGTSYKSVVVRDAAAAMAALRAQAGVDPEQVAVAGASLGGEIAVTLAALDERIAATAFSSFGGNLGPNPLAAGARAKPHHYCHLIPGTQGEFNIEDLLLLIAPRPLAGFRGGRDGTVAAELRDLLDARWDLLGAVDSAGIQVIDGGGHDFFIAETIGFLNRNLAR